MSIRMPRGWVRRSCLGVALLATSLCSTPARAQWSVDVAVERFSWHEDVPPLDVREVGPRVGLGVGFMQRRERGVLFAYRGSMYGGHVNYDGSLLLDPNQSVQGVTAYFGTTQTAELRHRWPAGVDVVGGLELDLWRRWLSRTQREEYRIISARLGVERRATRPNTLAVGGGLRWVLDTREEAVFSGNGAEGRLNLVPARGWNPYGTLGWSITAHITAGLYWDGMRLGRSPDLVVDTGGGGTAVVFQPATDVNVFGLRVMYAF